MNWYTPRHRAWCSVHWFCLLLRNFMGRASTGALPLRGAGAVFWLGVFSHSTGRCLSSYNADWLLWAGNFSIQYGMVALISPEKQTDAMLKDNSHGDRKNIRLKNHNYNENGFYFFTLCTQNRQCLFSSIVDDTMQVDGAGEMVASTWQEIPCFYAGVVIDQMCIMPNHFHGILELDRSLTVAESEVSLSFPDVIHRFKTLTTKRYSDGVKGLGWPRFDARLWQRNYWERVIRNDKELSEIREYINNNPAKWALDKLYV